MTTGPGPVRKAALAFIFVTVALDMLALGIIVPVLPKLVLEFEGGDSAGAASIYGVFGTTFAAMQFLCAPLLGALSDRLGRRPVILISTVGLGLDYVIMALAPSIAWLFAGRVLSGICSASISTAGAYITDVTPPERRAASFGLINAGFGFGFVVGPAVGGLLGSVDPRLPFWGAAALSLTSALYGLFVLPESLTAEARAAFEWRRANPVGAFLGLRRHGQVLAIAAVMFFSHIAHEVNPSTFVLYTDYRYAWDARTVGLALAAIGVLSVVVGGAVRVVVDYLGERATLLAGLVVGASGLALQGVAASGRLFAAGVPLVALWGLAGPTAQALMTRQVEPSEQGRLQGTIAGLRAVGDMIGPVLFTSVFAASIGRLPAWDLPGAPFLLAACLLGASATLAWRVTRRTK
jgi:DHA1 family tetracycline resistance protein-like MFS transporter